ncbi:hypothetical protein ACPRNU_20365 [Chromobacterium vaccinii]|uniref:hypothetical protein n=1 Tax=Chromobacterium vaccinii TaxID=1108595 RepID=UPI003C75F4FD
MQSHTQNFNPVQNFSQAHAELFHTPYISRGAKNSYHLGMGIDVFDIRRANLVRLLKPRGAAARIADMIGSSASYLSTLKNQDLDDPNSRRMGDGMARRIEDAEGLEHGWMDISHESEDVEHVESVVVTASDEEELVKLLREKGEAYAFELLRKAFMEQENKKGD